MACPTQQCFSTLSHKGHGFTGGGVGVIEYKICFLISSTTLVQKISHSKEEMNEM